jgi:hypothetical protein
MENTGDFFITSYGRTATTWLSTALSLHPDMHCTHGPTFGLPNMKMFLDERKEAAKQIDTTMPQFYDMSLREILDRTRAGSKKPWIGNIHAFTASNLKLKSEAEQNSPPFRTVNIVRHPVSRIQSLWQWMIYERTIDTAASRWISEDAMSQPNFQGTLKELQRHHDVTVESYPERAFFYSVMTLGTDGGDFRIPVTHVTSERLVKDIDYFAYVLTLLTGTGSVVQNNHLQEVQQLGRIGASNEKKPAEPAIQVFSDWKLWQRSLFQMVMNSDPVMKATYPQLGYGLLEFGVH